MATRGCFFFRSSFLPLRSGGRRTVNEETELSCRLNSFAYAGVVFTVSEPGPHFFRDAVITPAAEERTLASSHVGRVAGAGVAPAVAGRAAAPPTRATRRLVRKAARRLLWRRLIRMMPEVYGRARMLRSPYSASATGPRRNRRTRVLNRDNDDAILRLDEQKRTPLASWRNYLTNSAWSSARARRASVVSSGIESSATASSK